MIGVGWRADSRSVDKTLREASLLPLGIAVRFFAGHCHQLTSWRQPLFNGSPRSCAAGIMIQASKSPSWFTVRWSPVSKGFGFVERSSDAEAQAAIDGLYGKDVNGRNLTVNERSPRPLLTKSPARRPFTDASAGNGAWPTTEALGSGDAANLHRTLGRDRPVIQGCVREELMLIREFF
jgi:hypothetical protein